MKINVLSIFPEFFESFLNTSIVKRAITNELLTVNLVNFRDYSTFKYQRVDDYQYGGGEGMVLSVEPIHRCLSAIKEPGLVVALTPIGEVLSEQIVRKLATNENLTLICGHYEGFDERVYDYVDQRISIGDYVVSGGEVAACVVIDAINRKLAGVIAADSVANDSFVDNLLDYPVYTKPLVYDGKTVPEVLLSGDHQAIAKFRKAQALENTLKFRKDLLENGESNEK